jgi:O-antigen/teichoic acid export membrane protein
VSEAGSGAVALDATVPLGGATAAAPSLSRRASLNAVAALLDYGAKVVVGLVVTPILVGALGRTLFGTWEMLSRLAGYAATADGRPTQALRLLVARHQYDVDDAPKRRLVGAALGVWLAFLPLVAAVGAVLIAVSPLVARAPASLHGSVRAATALLVAALLVGGLAAIPESVLRGMNLGFRRMGVQAGLSVVGGVLMVAAVSAGLGLVGLGAAQLALVLATGVCFTMLTRRFVPWFGARRPGREEFRSFLGTSGWLVSGDIVAKLLLASDVVILGVLMAPAAVTPYVLTGYAARTALGVHEFTVGSAMPGVGGLIGRGDREKAAEVRATLLALTWLFGTTIGTILLAWNRAFVGLWTGAEHYAGPWVNALVACLAVQTTLIRTDAYVIDAALRPKARVIAAAAAAVLTVALATALTWAYGTVGLCAGILGGRLVQSVAYPIIVARALGRRAAPGVPLRPLAVTAVLFAGAFLLGERVTPPGWIAWILGVAASALVVSALAFTLGLSAPARRSVWQRLRALVRGGRRG